MNGCNLARLTLECTARRFLSCGQFVLLAVLAAIRT